MALLLPLVPLVEEFLKDLNSKIETVQCYKCDLKLLKGDKVGDPQMIDLGLDTVTLTTYHNDDGHLYHYTNSVGSNLCDLLHEDQYYCFNCLKEVELIISAGFSDASIATSKSTWIQFLEWMYELRGGLNAFTKPYCQAASFNGGPNSLAPSIKAEDEFPSSLPVLPVPMDDYAPVSDDEKVDDQDEDGYSWQSFSSALDKVIRLHSEYVPTDRDLQRGFQACLLSCYVALYDIDDMHAEVLIEELNNIGSKLSDIDFFELTKAMGVMCKAVVHTSPHLTFPDISQFHLDLLKASDRGECYATMEICLKAYLQQREYEEYGEELQALMVETIKSSPWTAEEVLRLTNSYTPQDMSKKLHVVLRYQLPYSALHLEHKYISDKESPLQEIMKKISESKLLEEHTLKLTHTIVQKMLSIRSLSDHSINNLQQAIDILMEDKVDTEQLSTAVIFVLDILYHGVRHTLDQAPTKTQLVSVCILLLSHQDNVSSLLEVLTGEGKSLIIAMFAIVVARKGKAVDILTTTPDLAQRDVDKFQALYDLFNVSVAHNTETKTILDKRPKEADEERRKIYGHSVVYGTVNDFAGDLLRDEFEMRTIRRRRGEKRRMEIAIVDEMDMLMLDKGVQFTYLSHHSAIMHHLEQVLAMVWSHVHQNTPFITASGATLFAGVPKFIHNVIFEGIPAAFKKYIGDPRKILQAAANADFIDKTTLAKIFQANSPEMKKSAMSVFRTTSMIQLVRYLQQEYLPGCEIAVYLANQSGELVRQDYDEILPAPIPQFSLLVLDEGLACPLHTQESLADGIERMVSVQCDLPSKLNRNLEKIYTDKNGVKYYEGMTDFFHEILFNSILRSHKVKVSSPEKILDLAVNYEIMSDSEMTQFLLATDEAEKLKAMKNLTESKLNMFLYKLSTSGDFPFSVIPCTLTSGGKLSFRYFENWDFTTPMKCPCVPVVLAENGKLYSLHLFDWIKGATTRSFEPERGGWSYWLGQCKFFHKVIYEVLSSDQILFSAAELHLLDEPTVKQILQSEVYSKKQSALSSIQNNQILSLLRQLGRSRSHELAMYTSGGDDRLQLESSDCSAQTIPHLYLGKGMMCQLHTVETVEIPAFMKNFVVHQLPRYIQSAFTASLMTESREYLVTNKRIIPVDYEMSGVIEMNKRWGGGLQQMLEMKHLLKLSPLSVTTNFVSHLCYFGKYSSLYGLSGTIGLECEQRALKGWYKLHTCKIPPSKERHFYERNGIIVPGSRINWLSQIHSTLVEVTSGHSKRAALVLCEDIRTCKEIKDFLCHKKNLRNIYTYFNSEEPDAITSVRSSGDIIVATNLAGRGTDIKVSEEVNAYGGLFCLLTFLPTSKRVELQAFGRTARNGQPGSGQLILHKSSLPCGYRDLDLSSIRSRRDSKVRHQLEKTMQEVKTVLLRQKLFASHCSILEKVHNSDRDDKSELLECINDCWGQWLLTKHEQIMELEDDKLVNELCQLHKHCLAYFRLPKMPQTNTICNFIHLIKLGNRMKKSHGCLGEKRAIEFYSIAIEMERWFRSEPKFTAFAYYNRAYCTIQTQSSEVMRIKDDISKAQDLLQVFIEEAQLVLVTAKGACKSGKPADSDLQTQMQVRLNVLDFVHKKMGEALKKIEEFQKNGDDFKAVVTDTLEMIPNSDMITEDEVLDLSRLGLDQVFTVKKKPKFSWGAFAVFVLGLVEIAAGAILMVLTAGIGAEIGMGLIAEGVSDCIDGTIGMITGEFSWSQWATQKAISIAVSIATFGVGKFIGTGAKLAAQGEKAAVELGEEGAEMAMKKLPEVTEEAGKEAEKLTLKDAGKAIGKEFVQQATMRGLSVLENKVLEELVDKIAHTVTMDCGVEQSLTEAFSGQNPLGVVVDRHFASRLGPSYVKLNVMSPVLKKEAIDFFNTCVNQVVSSLVSSSPTFGVLMTGVADVIHNISGKLKGKASVVHFFEAGPVLAAITRTEYELDNLLKKFEPMLIDKCKDPKQAEDFDDLKAFLSRQTSLALAKAIVDEAKNTSYLCNWSLTEMSQDLSEENKEALDGEFNALTKQLYKLTEPYLRKSFSDDQELGGIVKMMFVCKSPHKDRPMPRSSAVKFFEEAVHEVFDHNHLDSPFQIFLTLNCHLKNPPHKWTKVVYPDLVFAYTNYDLPRVSSWLCEYCKDHIKEAAKVHTHVRDLTHSLSQAKIHDKLHSQCTKFFEVHGKTSSPCRRDLSCVEDLKKTLATKATDAFTEAVSSIILQNLGWIANQHLNRTVNAAAGHAVVKAGKKAAEPFLKTPVRDVRKRGEKLCNPSTSWNEVDLEVAAKRYGRCLVITDESSQTKRPFNYGWKCIDLIKGKDGKYRLPGEEAPVVGEGNGLPEAFTRSLRASGSSEVTTSKVRNAVADEITTSPDRWVHKYEAEKKREAIEYHVRELTDPETLGTVAEIAVAEEKFSLSITVVNKHGKILRSSKQETSREVTLVYTKDKEHPEGHYSVKGRSIESEYGNCLFESLAHEINEKFGRSSVVDAEKVRSELSREICNNPERWHDLYMLKAKYEKSWLYFRRSRLLKGAGKQELSSRKATNLKKVLKDDKTKSQAALRSFIRFVRWDPLKVTCLFRMQTLEKGEEPKSVDGYCSTTTGKHAEERVIQQLEEHFRGKQPSDSVTELMLSHSPCLSCRKKLSELLNKIPGKNKKFTLHVASIYTRGEVEGTPVKNLGKWLGSLEMSGIDVDFRPVKILKELESSEKELRRRFKSTDSKWTNEKKKEIQKRDEKVVQQVKEVKKIFELKQL